MHGPWMCPLTASHPQILSSTKLEKVDNFQSTPPAGVHKLKFSLSACPWVHRWCSTSSLQLFQRRQPINHPRIMSNLTLLERGRQEEEKRKKSVRLWRQFRTFGLRCLLLLKKIILQDFAFCSSLFSFKSCSCVTGLYLCVMYLFIFVFVRICICLNDGSIAVGEY